MRVGIVAILAGAMMATGAGPAKPASLAEKVAVARRQMIGTIPQTQPGVFEEKKNSDGNYIYEATSAKALVDAVPLQIEADKIVKGLTVAKAATAAGLSPDNQTNAGLYWTLKNIDKGPYWIGIVYEGNGSVTRGGIPTVYLNGRIVQLAAESNPVQVAPGVWFVEAFAGKAEELAPGDEIEVAFNRDGTAARIILHGKAPEPVSESPWKMPTNFGGNQWILYTALGVNAEGKFKQTDGKHVPNFEGNSLEQVAASISSIRDETGKVAFSVYLSNPLPIALPVSYQCVIKSFYGDTVATDKQTLTLKPHEQLERKISFGWNEGELTYFADIVLLESNPPDLSKSRKDGGLGWPKYEALSFFPGHRQILKWPDPFNLRVLRRITISEPFGGSRQGYLLDGRDWEMGYTTKLEPPIPVPAEIKFQKTSVPLPWHSNNLEQMLPRPHGAYFRRSLTLPDDIAGRSFTLFISHVYCEATAYVNNIKCGNVRGEDTPLVCDMTKALKPGKNEIVIVVRDAMAIMDQDYVNKDSPKANLNYLDAPGIFGWQSIGIGSVEVKSAPVVSSEDVLIATSLRKQNIATKITAANRGHSDVSVKVSAEVQDDGKTVLELGERELALKPDEPVEFRIEKPWGNPVLWEPGNPHLYALKTTMTDVKTGKIMDVRRDRFGFRESWIDGPNIMFNGYPIKPPGYHFLFRLNPRGNFIFTRCAGRDYFDEIGIIGYWNTSGIRNTASQHNVESDKFWKTAEENNIAALRVKQNSPHLIAWDLSNEWLSLLQYSVNDIMQGARRFKHLSDVVRAYDPTRWTLGNGDGDFNGLLDNQSFHYIFPYFDNQASGMRGHSDYLPDGAFWRPLEKHFTPGQDIVLSPFHKTIVRPDKKVIMDTEFLWKVGTLMPPGPSAIAGEDDVLSAAVDSWSGPIAWKWKMDIDGHRDLGVSMTGVYSFHPGVIRGSYLEQALIIPENQHHAYGGSKQARRFTIINSLFRPHKMTLKWRLTAPAGKVVEKGDKSFDMNSGAIERGEFSFTLPEVSEKETYTLNATLESGGEFVCGEEWDMEVFPRKMPRIGGLKRNIILLGPCADTAEKLKELGATFSTMEGVPSGDPSSTLLVIGENVLDENTAKVGAGLVDFVEKGGRVLVLGQKIAPANLPVATKIAPKIWASQVFVRAGSHPIMKGITSYDLHFWQPERVVGAGSYTKPENGNVIVLADSGDWQEGAGLEWVQLMEVFRGKGSYILCQMPLVASFYQEPMAMEMLKRILSYMGGGEFPRCPVNTARVLTAPDSPLASKLKSERVEHKIIDASAVPTRDSPYLLDADSARQLDSGKRAEFAQRLREGATVAVVNTTPEDQKWLSGLAGTPVEIAAQPYPLWDGRGFRKGWSEYTAGLSHIDLYWKRFDGAESAAGQADDPNNVIESFQDYSASADKGRELIFPGALVEIKVGHGTLLLDQRRWTTENQALLKLAARNISCLMTSLDVKVAPYVQPKELPKDCDYKTVDLRPLANRALIDDVAEDGKGGWTDQGPNADLRTFPTGKQSFKGVPFFIGEAPKSCIVLASNARPGKDLMPKAVEIPIGFPAEGLFFIHGSAYTGYYTVIGNYRINYKDGTFTDIPLKGVENISDWARPIPLNNEKGTSSILAWTGKNNVFPLIGVYRMLWVNEKPDVPISSVVFSTPEFKGVPVLIGLTAAVKKGQFPISPENIAKAKKRFEDGKAAFARLQLEDARKMLGEAIDLDPSLIDAYQVFADVAEKKGEDQWILEAYGAWTYSGPRSPIPFNRIAETLEKKKDLKGALDNYKESLKVEWNQPPTIEAVKRLESTLR
jgi:hypothetical protein